MARESTPGTRPPVTEDEPPAAARAHLNRGNLLLASANIEEARRAYEAALACDPRYAAAHFNLGNLNYRAGEFARALRDYQAAASIRPQFAGAFVGMANALAGLGRTAEAIESCRHALTINPGSADTHVNLGVLAMTDGRLEEAAASLRRAIELRPDHAEAHRILYDLAMILEHRGKHSEAAQLLARLYGRAPSQTLRTAFAVCATRARFTVDDSTVRTALTAAINEAWAMPHDLCRAALSQITLDARIARCVRVANESWPVRPPRAALFGSGGLAALAADPLLRAVLEAAPVNAIHFERFLTCARHALLEIASGGQTPDPADAKAVGFYAALARQCFINEFVFDCSEEERRAAENCRRALLGLLAADVPVPPLLLLAVAAYFPLHLVPEPTRLLKGCEPGPVAEVLRQQIREPLEEQSLGSGIERLTPVTSQVSRAVRDQYEENPYPRWVRLKMPEQAEYFNAELHRALPFARFAPLADDRAPEVLVAGCGTGGDAILVAGRFRGARVLAIDLSVGSLAYAKRKTRELGLTNIEYAQADILELGSIARTFDVIGAVGVLHHLADPFEGWRILLCRLRPGGFMCLGLYSQIARRAVVKVREFVAGRGYEATADDIRRFRQDAMAEGASAEIRSISNSHAFYSMSDCRDLAFHVQEGHLTLEQIESFLSRSGSAFIGFELDPEVLARYRARFDGDANCTNLRNWARFEADNPDTFTAMYRFWIQNR
jgi:tetratricopeptide (TPR) repeat protein/SAM-dependent methyltransferase